MLSTDRPLTEQTYPTLLRTPGRYGFPNERILPGSASDYITEAVHPGDLAPVVPDTVQSLS